MLHLETRTTQDKVTIIASLRKLDHTATVKIPVALGIAGCWIATSVSIKYRNVMRIKFG